MRRVVRRNEARLQDLIEVTSAPRGFAGDSDAWFRRTEDSASDASADSASLAVAIDDRNFDDMLAEFDRRAALLNAVAIEDRRFALADFAEQNDRVAVDGGAESLPLVLRQSGSMPAEVGEECVRASLAALRSAHNRRWSHGRLSLDAFHLDPHGAVRLTGVGRLQRETLLRAAAEEDGLDVGGFDQDERSDRLWNEAFLASAAEDFRTLGPQVVLPLLQAIEGSRPSWAERLVRCLDGLDGTIGSLEDVQQAWQAIEACFCTGDSVEIPSLVEAFGANEAERVEAATPAESGPADPVPGVPAASRIVLFWFCIVGGLAAMAGTLATVIIGR